MLTKQKRTLIVFNLLLCLFFVVFVATPVLAKEDKNPATSSFRSGLDTTANKAFDGKPPSAKIPVILSKIVFAGLSLIGVVFFTLVVLAGFKWMNAGGHAEDVEKAQEMLRHAIIGLIITLGAATITWFILNSLQTAVKEG